MLGTGSPKIPSHVKLMDNNSILALVATGGLTATDQGSYVELSGSTLETALAGKQPMLGTGNPNIGGHVKLIDNNTILAVVATDGITATNQGSYVELSGATLESSIASKQDQLATGNPLTQTM